MNLRAIFSLVLVAWVAVALRPGTAFEFKDCNTSQDPSAFVLAFNIDACPNAEGRYCTLSKGKNATMTLDVHPARVFSQATIKLKAKIGPLWVPFKLPGSSDACHAYGLECPAVVGVQQRMVVSLPVLRKYPSIKATIRAELIDERKQTIVCMKFPVRVK